LLFSSPFSWLPCAISPPCKFASLALKRPYFLWARSSTPKILRYGCCNVNQKMHIGNQGHYRPAICQDGRMVRFLLSCDLSCGSAFIMSLRCAELFWLRCAARASGRKEISALRRIKTWQWKREVPAVAKAWLLISSFAQA
jgi:hypothetical protein